MANGVDDNVSVLLGNGDGTFQTAVSYNADNGPKSIAIDYLNGDTNLDLVVANAYSNNVSVLLGYGDGTFQAPVNYAAGDYPSSMAINDFDGDDDTDLAIANWDSYHVSVLLGNGDGTFGAPVAYEAFWSLLAVASDDLDGDGNPDLVAASDDEGDTVTVLLGNGDGTFQAALHSNPSDYILAIAVNDLDGDGVPDLVTVNGAFSATRNRDISVILGNGDGTFGTAMNYNAGSSPGSAAIDDLDGDGDHDLAVTNYSSDNVSVFINRTLPVIDIYVDDDAPNDPGPGDPDVSDPLEDGSIVHPFDAIQEGIDNAVNGDTVEVREGTYSGTGNYSIDFSGKEILVCSENGAESCFIDGDGPTTGGVVFENGEGNDAILRGFTIHNINYECDHIGDRSPIHIVGASPTIESNIIENNDYGYNCVSGLAIHCENSGAVIQDNVILDNYIEGSCYGTIYCQDSNLTILSNTLHGNILDEHGKGAGIYCNNSSVEIIGNVITDNILYYGGGLYGGGICCISTSALIAGNTITGNKIYEGGYGGGIYCQGASPVFILDNVISGNDKLLPHWAFDQGTLGGGIYCECDAVIAGNIITDNCAYRYSDGGPPRGNGGGIYCGSGSPTIVNNFIAGNCLDLDEVDNTNSSGLGGGIYCGPDSSPVISNNTILDNYCFGENDGHGLGIYCESSSAVIANCIVRGNEIEQIGGCYGLVSYSNVEGGYLGMGNIDSLVKTPCLG